MGRKKSTFYLDDAADMRLEAVARRIGVSKAEVIRRFIDEGLQQSETTDPLPPLPKYRSDRPLSVDQMDEAIYQSMKRRSDRR